jgi:hypothetical protein
MTALKGRAFSVYSANYKISDLTSKRDVEVSNISAQSPSTLNKLSAISSSCVYSFSNTGMLQYSHFLKYASPTCEKINRFFKPSGTAFWTFYPRWQKRKYVQFS